MSDETEVTPADETEVTPAGVLAKLGEAISGASPFTMDSRIARIRQVGIGLAEAVHRAEVAHKHAATLDSVAVELANKALVTLAEATAPSGPEAPRKRGRPPGSKNAAADATGNATPTSDSPAGGLAD